MFSFLQKKKKKKKMKNFFLIFFVIFLMLCKADKELIFEDNYVAPNIYSCQKTTNPPIIDGIIGDEEWKQAQFSPPFVDISDPTKKPLNYSTRVKMLYDDKYLYIAALLTEKGEKKKI